MAQSKDPDNGLPEFVGGPSHSGQVARTTPMIRAEQYAGIGSFQDAVALAQEAGLDIIESDELGDGFGPVIKSSLVGVPMVCLAVSYNPNGDQGPYLAFRCVTEDGRKIAFADGGTGLFATVKEYMDSHGGKFPVMWRHGLRESSYGPHVNAAGHDVPAGTTYYLDTSK